MPPLRALELDKEAIESSLNAPQFFARTTIQARQFAQCVIGARLAAWVALAQIVEKLGRQRDFDGRRAWSPKR